jgi:hypothetical protein
MKWAAALSILASVALYAPSLEHFFVSDDFLNLERNRQRSITDFFHAFSTVDVDFYRPIPRLHFGLMEGFFESNVVAWNLAGVLLHGIAAALAAALARELFGPRSRTTALFTGLFFAVHFIHAEAVVWASGVTSVYDAIFVFATILFFRRSRRAAGAHRVRALTLTVIACAAALLSKESAIALVALLPLTTWVWPPAGPDGTPTSRVLAPREIVPLAILFVAYAAIVIPIDRGGALSPYRMSLGPHVVKNLAFFLLGCFAPVRFWEIQDLWKTSFGFVSFAVEIARHARLALPLAAGALAIGAVLVRGGRDGRGALAWIVCAALPHLLLPGSGERFLYVPSFGACVLFGLGAAALRRRGRGAGTVRHRIARGALAAASIAAMFALHVGGSLDRQGDWSVAGKWTRGIVGRWGYFSGLAPDLSIEFSGVPERWGSAWVFRNGFPSMVRLYWEGRDYWREEERAPGRVADQRIAVVLHPGGAVGMMPAHLRPRGTP